MSEEPPRLAAPTEKRYRETEELLIRLEMANREFRQALVSLRDETEEALRQARLQLEAL